MGRIQQAVTSAAASYGMLMCGLLYVWPSYTASVYTAANGTVLSTPMSAAEVSLIGSVPSLGAMVGSGVAGPIVAACGRQRGVLLLMLPFLLAWVMIDLTSSSTVIVVARFISGLPCGAALVYGPIYISEVAEESIRGLLATGPTVFYCLGVILSYLFGWLLPYRMVLWANMAFTCLGLGLVLMASESPVWLMRQNREEDARLAIANYRGVSPGSKIVLEEISRLRAQVLLPVEMVSISDGTTKADEAEEKLTVPEETAVAPKKVSTLKLLFLSPSSRRAFIVTGMTLSLQVMMGMIVVQVYAKDIFSSAAPSVSPHLCSVMLAAILLAGSLTSAACSDRFGRRLLLIPSAAAVVLCLIGMGLLIQTSALPAWVTAVLILVYCFAFMFGSGSVPYVLLAEAFVPEVQSLASMLLMEWVWLLNFFLLGVFPFLVQHFGVHGAFYSFSIFGILDVLVGLFMLPETKGLTKDQIQEAFLRRRKA